MAYHGTPFDNQIRQLPGHHPVWDGMSLPTDLIPLPISRDLPAVTRHPSRYRLISPGHVLLKNQLRAAGLVSRGARSHPRSFEYAAPATSRFLAHSRERPSVIAASWSAAAFYGFGQFSDDADTCVLSSGRRIEPAGVLHPRERRRLAYVEPWSIHVGDDTVKTVPPLLALIGCLRSLHDEEHSWEVVRVPGLTAPRVRMIQLVDRFRRATGLNGSQVIAGSFGLFQARRLQQIVDRSTGLSDSPQETALRLVLEQGTASLGVKLQQQIPIYKDGRIGEPGTKDAGAELLTIIDLADLPRRIAYMYDGEHHLDRSQRDRDAMITAELTRRGWLVIRISAGMLNDANTLIAQARESVAARDDITRLVG